MRIVIARTAGFCMGVRRAVDMALEAPARHAPPICTFGPLIHNPQVLGLLEKKGISVLKEIPEQGAGTVLLRAHGVPPAVKARLEAAGFRVVDATCPRVIKVQTIIKTWTGRGYEAVIIGDRDHPEVVGLLGYSDGRGHVAGSVAELDRLPDFEQAIVVAQTTQNTALFQECQERLSRRRPHFKIYNTICDSTEKRQAEVKRLARSVDTVIVAGGRNSGNTQRLAEIAAASGKPTHHVETAADVAARDVPAAGVIGLTAGASTPNWIIKQIVRSLQDAASARDRSFGKALLLLQRTLLMTNIYVSLGAGCLCFACLALTGLRRVFPYVLISVLYVQSMHILNHLMGREADHYNDPERAAFYDAHKFSLALLAYISGGAGLLMAFRMGLTPFLTLCVMSLMGLSYNLRILPRGLAGPRRRRIRDIPGSKTVLIAAAWAVVTTLFPALSESGRFTPGTALVFAWSFGMVFVRTAFFDILDMQGDRIVGKETIAILLGEKKALSLLKSMLAVLIILPPVASALGATTSLGCALPVCPVFMYFLLSTLENSETLSGSRTEFLMETTFILSGIIALAWTLPQ